jgi:hypothetical protein
MEVSYARAVSILDPALSAKANLAPMAVVPSVVSSPGWQVIGAFYQPEAAHVRLEMIVAVAQAERLFRGRLVREADLAAIEASMVSSSQQALTRVLSKPFDLLPDSIYEIQVECAGAEAPEDYAVIDSARVVVVPTE